ncbi:MAG: DUF1040 family protein [Lachnospiraceae bacterium]|nr:DUF1040 family protein [Lachnospiraceae bacterium]
MHRKQIKNMGLPVVYGIYGAARGTGCTHLALSAASYLSGTLGYKTALIEVGERKSLLSLYTSDKVASKIGNLRYFRYRFLDVYYNTDSPDLSCLSYERIILDLQEMPDDSILADLDILFILCDNKPWNESSLRSLYHLKKESTNRPQRIICIQKDREDGFRDSILKARKIKTVKLPVIHDPFSPGRDFRKISYLFK